MDDRPVCSDMLVAAAHLQLFETRRHATKTATRRGSRALIFTFPWGPGAGGAMCPETGTGGSTLVGGGASPSVVCVR